MYVLRNAGLWFAGCLVLEMQTGQPLFPGSSDIDQLWIILKSLPQDQLDELANSPGFKVPPSDASTPPCRAWEQEHCSLAVHASGEEWKGSTHHQSGWLMGDASSSNA